jgi:chromosome segregation ATPase
MNFQSLQQQLEAAWAEVGALREEAARKEQQLEAARAAVAALRVEGARKDSYVADLKQEARPPLPSLLSCMQGVPGAPPRCPVAVLACDGRHVQ